MIHSWVNWPTMSKLWKPGQEGEYYRSSSYSKAKKYSPTLLTMAASLGHFKGTFFYCLCSSSVIHHTHLVGARYYEHPLRIVGGKNTRVFVCTFRKNVESKAVNRTSIPQANGQTLTAAQSSVLNLIKEHGVCPFMPSLTPLLRRNLKQVHHAIIHSFWLMLCD